MGDGSPRDVAVGDVRHAPGDADRDHAADRRQVQRRREDHRATDEDAAGRSRGPGAGPGAPGRRACRRSARSTNWRKYIGARIATYSPASVHAWPKMIPNRNGETRAPSANGPIAVRARLRVVFDEQRAQARRAVVDEPGRLGEVDLTDGAGHHPDGQRDDALGQRELAAGASVPYTATIQQERQLEAQDVQRDRRCRVDREPPVTDGRRSDPGGGDRSERVAARPPRRPEQPAGAGQAARPRSRTAGRPHPRRRLPGRPGPRRPCRSGSAGWPRSRRTTSAGSSSR